MTAELMTRLHAVSSSKDEQRRGMKRMYIREAVEMVTQHIPQQHNQVPVLKWTSANQPHFHEVALHTRHQQAFDNSQESGTCCNTIKLSRCRFAAASDASAGKAQCRSTWSACGAAALAQTRQACRNRRRSTSLRSFDTLNQISWFKSLTACCDLLICIGTEEALSSVLVSCLQDVSGAVGDIPRLTHLSVD